MNFLKHGIVIFVIIALTGCADTMQPRRFAPLGKDLGGSGFLGGLYASMHEGKDGQYRLVYQNPKVLDREWFAQYRKILLDPVQLYAGPNSTLPKVSQEQRETLAKAFYARIYHEFEKDYEMVTQPGPKTFRIQVAIVDAEESGGVLEAISYIPIPAGVPGAKMALLQLKDKATGKPFLTGEITAEAKYVDAQSEEVLAAAVDRRVGVRKPFIGLFQKATYNTWNDVDQAMRYWAEKQRYQFCLRRGATNCVVPVE